MRVRIAAIDLQLAKKHGVRGGFNLFTEVNIFNIPKESLGNNDVEI